MCEEINEIGLFWQPLGGNNFDQVSGHCYHYMDIEEKNGKKDKTSIIIDIGKYDNHHAFGIKDSIAAIPDIRHLLEKEGTKAQAIFLTHSHPDHINGIVHYIRAGYELPNIYSGEYTFIILKDLLKYFNVDESKTPKLIPIKDGDIVKIGSFEIEAISTSHTCFDSLGFIIKTSNACVYHTGDMKVDSSTYFRKPTNIKRIKELAGKIDFVLADFCQIFRPGYTPREIDSFNCIYNYIKNSKKDKTFIGVYPTHPQMYIIAFLAALKAKKNIVFHGSDDFYSYLKLISQQKISFKKIAKGKIKIAYNLEEFDSIGDSFVVIGDYRNIDPIFEADSSNSFSVITSKVYFNPLRKELNEKGIHFIDTSNNIALHGYGHGFFKDYKMISSILDNPIFIPTHCPMFIVDNFRELAKIADMRMVERTPYNYEIYKLSKGNCDFIKAQNSKWLVVKKDFSFNEVNQVPTAGKGFIKGTISKKRSIINIKTCLEYEKAKK